jgi:hypothetical protein
VKELPKTQHYHQFVKFYEGQGHIYLSDRRQFDCDFDCGQADGGQIYVRVHLTDPVLFGIFNDLNSVLYLSGLTTLGHYIRANISVAGPGEFSWDANSFSGFFSFYATDVVVGNALTSPLNALKFYLANLEFVRQFELHFPGYDIAVKKVAGYDEAVKEMHATKRPKITAELTITSSNNRIANEYEAERILHDLCALLSLAKGCKIQWLYWDAQTPDGSWVKSYHWNGKITPYSSWQIIVEKPAEDLIGFLGQTFTRYQDVNEGAIWEFDQAIDHYADTVSRESLLELRAMNLAVLIDYLTRRYDTYRNYKGDYFALRLQNLLGDHSLKVASQEETIFIKMRNKLVHEASFLEPSDYEKMKLPYERPERQFFRIVSLTGRIMLAILQYRGYYYDWQKFKRGEWAGAETARVKMP